MRGSHNEEELFKGLKIAYAKTAITRVREKVEGQ